MDNAINVCVLAHPCVPLRCLLSLCATVCVCSRAA